MQQGRLARSRPCHEAVAQRSALGGQELLHSGELDADDEDVDHNEERSCDAV